MNPANISSIHKKIIIPKIMDPFRGYLKAKIKEGEMESFQSLVPPFVNLVKETELRALQFEAFTNEKAGEIIWLESYTDNTGFDVHIANPALDELKMKMMPLQESIQDMYFMSAPTEAAWAGLHQYGIHPNVLVPWPGTSRLTEERNEEARIQIFLTIDVADLDAYRKIAIESEKMAANQPGILFHRTYQISDNRVAVLEEYKDSDSLVAWFNVFAENFSEINALIKGITVEVCGNPTTACKEMLDGWGAVYFKKIAGFTRFN